MEHEEETAPSLGPIASLMLLVELFAFFSLGYWGFVTWASPWNIAAGLITPAIGVVLWALFCSPKSVVHVDTFGRAIVEIIIMAAAALGWWGAGHPIVALVFAVIATVVGILNGRKALA